MSNTKPTERRWQQFVEDGTGRIAERTENVFLGDSQIPLWIGSATEPLRGGRDIVKSHCSKSKRGYEFDVGGM